MDEHLSTEFLRQNALTRRFTLGVPHHFRLSDDGSRIAFLRSPADDPVTSLWLYDVARGEERLLVDAAELLPVTAAAPPAEERARRERAREPAQGIVRFSADDALRRVVFDLNGCVYASDASTGRARRRGDAAAAVDVRIDPSGDLIAYVEQGSLHVIAFDGDEGRCLLRSESDDVTYGLAEFVAAEEMGRSDGYWWSPDGRRLLVARVDSSAVEMRYIADPSEPAMPAVPMRYPRAGTRNAVVTLLVAGVDGGVIDVDWDNERFEYLCAACWSRRGLLISVQTRDQRTVRVLEVDPESGKTSLIREDTDPAWVDVVAGVPDRLGDGSLVWTCNCDGAKRLLIGDAAVTGDGVQVREVLHAGEDTVLFTASSEPTEVDVWHWSRDRGAEIFAGQDASPGVRTAVRRGGTTVLVSRVLSQPGVRVTVNRDGHAVQEIASLAERPVVLPRPRILRLGARQLRSVLLLPTDHVLGTRKLPVLLDPYGGPAAQRVLASHDAYLESQWLADQGFAVLIVDGAGTPGRGPEWSRSIRGNRADPVLDDQVAGLHAAAQLCPDLDTSRVGIRGWSYGGFLAALAVLRRPDVFHAAVAGAPVTDQRLYDTHYTERYLGLPDAEQESYDRMSLLADAPKLRRPLMLVHGLGDDNVSVANTLRLSAALLAASRPHSTLLLSRVTHSTNRPDVAATLPLLQLDFLRRALAAE